MMKGTWVSFEQDGDTDFGVVREVLGHGKVSVDWQIASATYDEDTAFLTEHPSREHAETRARGLHGVGKF